MATPATVPAATSTVLDQQLDRLAAFEPTNMPVLSLYLNLQADEHGRDNYEAFLRKEFARQAASFPKKSPEQQSFEKDAERIRAWLNQELARSANGVAIFACSAQNDFFEAIQLEAPVDEHRLYVYHQPHLYTLARLYDQFPRYAAVVADTNSARVFVFGLRRLERTENLQNEKVNRTKVGGWSQARYQRHVEKFQSQHVKELMETLERVVRQEKIDKILFAGDDVLTAFLREELTPTLTPLVVDILKLDIRTSDHTVLEETLAAIRQADAQSDIEKVRAMFDSWRAGGLAAAGIEEVMRALANGQVDELLITAQMEQQHPAPESVSAELTPELADLETPGPEDTKQVLLADELVTRARQTGAHVTFIEDPALLADVEGIAATLRFKLQNEGEADKQEHRRQ